MLSIPEALLYGDLVMRAEQVVALPTGAAPTSNIYALPPGYTLVCNLFANDLSTDLCKRTDYLPFGFVANKGTDYVVALRGTETVWEWMQDFRFEKLTCPFMNGSGETEDGFTGMYMSLCAPPPDGSPANGTPRAIDTLRALLAGVQGATLTICGHSLGSALATLLAMDLVWNRAFTNPTVYTFASPNVGDPVFANLYNQYVPNTWRIANQMDIVTHVPSPLLQGYAPVGNDYALSPIGKVLIEVACLHHLRSYLHLLSVIGGIPGYPLDPQCVPRFGL